MLGVQPATENLPLGHPGVEIARVRNAVDQA
jgi:hypothetical protein